MDYKKYYEIYYSYRQAKNDLYKLQNDIADIITNLMSTSYKLRDNISICNNNNDKILQLTAKKIEIENQLKLAKDLLKIRTEQKSSAEIELKKSTDSKDIIYVKFYIEHMKPIEISKQLNFARSYIYNLLDEIKAYISNYDKNIKNSRKVDINHNIT